MVSTLLLAAAVLAPKGVATSLAGHTIVDRDRLSHHHGYDPASRFFLLTTADADGGYRSVTLTRDRRVEAQWKAGGYNTEPHKTGPIHLKTNLGVRIGMTRSQITQIMGQPKRTAVRGKNREYWSLLYYYRWYQKSLNSYSLISNTYTCKNGKLIEIEINYGYDSGTVPYLTNWPWTIY